MLIMGGLISTAVGLLVVKFLICSLLLVSCCNRVFARMLLELWHISDLFECDAVNAAGKQRDFGGIDRGDDQAALLNPASKLLTQIVQDDSFREFEFRQYLFACQSKVSKIEK